MKNVLYHHLKSLTIRNISEIPGRFQPEDAIITQQSIRCLVMERTAGRRSQMEKIKSSSHFVLNPCVIGLICCGLTVRDSKLSIRYLRARIEI